MKVHRCILIALMIVLLVSCHLVKKEELETLGESLSETKETELEQETPSEVHESSSETTGKVKKSWIKEEPVDLNGYLNGKGQRIEIKDREIKDGKLLLAVNQIDGTRRALSGMTTKEILSYSLSDRVVKSLHVFQHDTRVWATIQAEEGLYCLEIFFSELLEGATHVKIKLYREDGSEELIDEFHIDDFRRVSNFIKDDKGVYYLKNAYVFENENVVGMDSDFVVIQKGKKQTLFHVTALVNEMKMNRADEVLHFPQLSKFGERMCFSTGKAGKTTLYLYSEKDGLVALHPNRESYNFTLLKDHAICIAASPDKQEEILIMDIASLNFISQTMEMNKPWRMSVQYDDNSRVYYEKTFIPEKNVIDTMTGTINRLWVDEKGLVQTDMLTETELIEKSNIVESIAAEREGAIVSIVQKTIVEEIEGVRIPKQTWSLVVYRPQE